MEIETREEFTKLNEEVANRSQAKEEAERDLIVAGNTKRSIEKDIVTKMKMRDQLELKTILALKKAKKKALLQEAIRNNVQFSSSIQRTLGKLNREEAFEWLNRAKSYLSRKELFPGKFILARILGFRGPGIAEAEKN